MNILEAPPGRATTLQEYAQSLHASGLRTYAGANGTYWVSSPERVVRRLPTFHMEEPTAGEVERALSATGGLLASYVIRPNEQHVANSWVYLCSDGDYALRPRVPAMQRNVRRAMRELTIAPLSQRDVLEYGPPAFIDTRRRAGLDDATLGGFRRYFERGIDVPGRAYLGAWRHGELAAFISVIRIDDWAEIGSFSMDSMLRHRPNDGLMYAVLSKYMTEPTCRIVSFGLSSVQVRSNAAGLHRFKVKVGFDPIPVHRAFVLHPSVRAIGNRITLRGAAWVVDGVLRLSPRNRRLRKLGGMLRHMLRPASTTAMERRLLDMTEDFALP